MKRQSDNKIIILFFALISSLIGCNTNNHRDYIVEARKAAIQYKTLYDFDVDSLEITVNGSKANNIKPAYPVIFYSKMNDSIHYNYVFNKSIDSNLTSFSFDSIKTIILLEHTKLIDGHYSNGKTIAYKVQTKISFIDKNSMREIKTLTLDGEAPPSSISYRRTAPDSKTGKGLAMEEIFQIVKNEILSQNGN